MGDGWLGDTCVLPTPHPAMCPDTNFNKNGAYTPNLRGMEGDGVQNGIG